MRRRADEQPLRIEKPNQEKRQREQVLRRRDLFPKTGDADGSAGADSPRAPFVFQVTFPIQKGEKGKAQTFRRNFYSP